MIQQLKATNLNFTSDFKPSFNEFANSAKTTTTAVKEEPKQDVVEVSSENSQAQEAAPKKTFMETITNIRNKGVHLLKGVNNVSGVTQGAIKGVVAGGAAMVGTGIIVKSCKDTGGNIINIAGNLIKNTFKLAANILALVPNTIKALFNAVKPLGQNIGQFYKNNKLAAGVATAVGLGVLAFNVIKGKLSANQNNANIDHKINEGHNKY